MSTYVLYIWASTWDAWYLVPEGPTTSVACYQEPPVNLLCIPPTKHVCFHILVVDVSIHTLLHHVCLNDWLQRLFWMDRQFFCLLTMQEFISPFLSVRKFFSIFHCEKTFSPFLNMWKNIFFSLWEKNSCFSLCEKIFLTFSQCEKCFLLGIGSYVLSLHTCFLPSP